MEEKLFTEVSPEAQPEAPQPEARRTNPVIWIVIAFVLLALMAGAAFVGGKLLTGSGLTGIIPGLSPMGGLAGPGGMGQAAVSIALHMTPAPELPTRRPDLSGIYVSRDGNNITVQEVLESPGGAVSSAPSGGGASLSSDGPSIGPEVEIVVTGDTQIYKDVTEMQMMNPGSDVEMVITQKVELVNNADEVGQNSMVQVWGERVGDRIIAHTLFYTEPMMIQLDENGGYSPASP